jgi:hypothetical protein
MLICNPNHKFPENYVQVAKAILDKLEAAKWGAEDVEAEDVVDEEDIIGAASTSTSAPVKKPERNLNDTNFPDDSDPIFGINGIMHHILRIRGPKTVSYAINPSYISKNSKVFGHNGLQIGQCFPTRMAALRDGAHGLFFYILHMRRLLNID